MKSTIAILCLMVGTGLLVWGYRESQTLKGQLHQVLSTSTNNRVTWMYIGGAVLVTAGVFQVYGGKK
jgi:hypothetical protein